MFASNYRPEATADAGSGFAFPFMDVNGYDL